MRYRIDGLDPSVIEQALKQGQAVRVEQVAVGCALRVGHHAHHVAALVADASDVLRRAVGVGFGRNRTVGRRVAKHDLTLVVEGLEGILVSMVSALAMGNGYLVNPGLREASGHGAQA